MLFGKSLFQSVVDRLDAEAEDDPSPEDSAFRISGLATSFVPTAPEASSVTGETETDARLDAYRFLMPEDVEPEPPAPSPPPEWLDRLSLEEITADLGLDPSDDRDRLQERRRTFARDNHPDRVENDFREAATIRMKIANRLIDEALRSHDLRHPGIGR